MRASAPDPDREPGTLQSQPLSSAAGAGGGALAPLLELASGLPAPPESPPGPVDGSTPPAPPDALTPPAPPDAAPPDALTPPAPPDAFPPRPPSPMPPIPPALV